MAFHIHKLELKFFPIHGRRLPNSPLSLPSGLRALVSEESQQGRLRQQLQQALVAQYSTDEHAVKLREVGHSLSFFSACLISSDLRSDAL